MNIRAITACLAAAVLALALAAGEAWSQQKPKIAAPNTAAPGLAGSWELFQTKAPGEPYKPSYKDRPFVNEGPQAFALIMEYRKDGTFRRISRVGSVDTVREGTWKMDGQILRQRIAGAGHEEVMFLRFDSPDQFTYTEVYEETPDPGLFARFRRVK